MVVIDVQPKTYHDGHVTVDLLYLYFKHFMEFACCRSLAALKPLNMEEASKGK